MMFTNRRIIPVLGAVVICTLPHLLNVSLWVSVICLCMWLYTAAAATYSWRLPNKLTVRFLAVIFFTGALTTHEGFTLEAFVALLALMVNLKLLDASSGKDLTITVILCYFLIVAGLFFGDSVGTTCYLLLSIFFTTAVLIHVNHPAHPGFNPLTLSGTLMFQALPLAVVMFMLFPRIEGGLWGRAPVNSARTGFSDTMSFGNMARLARSSDVAFRVEFGGTIPPRDQLYWRGIVLWAFDGETWSRGIQRRNISTRPPKPSRPIRYTVILEPHNEHWLLLLDIPTRLNFRRAWLNSDHTCYRWWPITKRIRYSGVSDIDVHAWPDDQFINQALALPAKGNPRARALAKSIAAQTRDKAAYISAILKYFNDQHFSYTLNPPPLAGADDTGSGNDLVDRFLFESRRGFCEHFAGSFAFLMRAAGIPARVVTGYQGGTLNEYGGYLVVRQSEAHAWCEVWMVDRGWVRVDPTGIVAPARLTGDTANALPPGETAGLVSLLNRGPLGELLGVLDFVNSKWNRWVMDYSPYDDLDFLVRLGIDRKSRKGWVQALLIVLIAGTMVTTLILVIFLLGLRRNEQDDIGRAWLVYCRKLAVAGFPRQPAQGPVDFMRDVVSRLPGQKEEIEKITASYVRLRYGRQRGLDEKRNLLQLVRSFTPKPD